jgi:outer membrane lipase/esterase
MGELMTAFRTVLALGLLLAPIGAFAQSLTGFYGFGDSTIDSGWYRNSSSGSAGFDARIAAAVALGGSAKPGGPGLMNSEVLAQTFGLGAAPANTPGGTNFATSGARAANVNLPGDGLFLGAVPTVTQINNYLATYGSADRNALYLISSGGNDVGFALDNLAAPARNAYVTGAANALVGGITTLSARGARYIIVPNLNEGFGNANTRALRALYNDTLWGGLAAAGVNFIPADSNAVRTVLANNPASFGIQLTGNGTTAPNTPSACVAPAGVNSAWGLICAPTTAPAGIAANLAANDATLTRLFADDQHFAAVGQKVYGDYYASLVSAPSQISLLAENPVKMRETLAAMIGDQIAISRRVQAPHGFHGWVSGNVSSLRFSNGTGFAGESSTPGQIVGGFDYRVLTDVLLGVAFSFDSKKASFSTAGTLRQDEYTISLYAGFARGPLWLDAIGTYGSLRYDVNRLVPIGITIQPNSGSTSGSNGSLAVTGGWDFVSGPWTHGPIAGILLQRVKVGGFTETGSFTSLAFGDQTRDSAVSQLGYRVALDAGMLRPFAKVAWNHELAAADRLVVTSLTTTIAPSYALPAIAVGRDWGTGQVGTQVALGAGVTGTVSVTGQVGQDRVVTYGASAGLNVAF